jgi:predicted RNA-binding Zn ribbon-like protein
VDKFVFVSGRPCLDFAGTMLWRRTLRTELITGPEDLGEWTRAAGLIGEPADPSAGDVEKAVSAREAMYVAITSAFSGTDGPAGEQIGLLNELAHGPLPTLTLSADGTTRREGSVANVVSLLARDAIDLIGSADIAKVKECANPDCTRLFVDHSRGFSRRWCGMAECGNKAKAADYRRRKKTRETPVARGS